MTIFEAVITLAVIVIEFIFIIHSSCVLKRLKDIKYTQDELNSKLQTILDTCIGGIEYRIINKEGKDLYECSIEAEKEGRKYAIDPDEPADLVVKTLIPAYKKLGRDRIIELLKQNKSEEEINEIAKSV